MAFRFHHSDSPAGAQRGGGRSHSLLVLVLFLRASELSDLGSGPDSALVGCSGRRGAEQLVQAGRSWCHAQWLVSAAARVIAKAQTFTRLLSGSGRGPRPGRAGRSGPTQRTSLRASSDLRLNRPVQVLGVLAAVEASGKTPGTQPFPAVTPRDRSPPRPQQPFPCLGAPLTRMSVGMGRKGRESLSGGKEGT